MPAGDDDDVFPRRLDALGRPLEGDEEGADQRGQLDRDPVEAGVVHHRADQRGQREPGEQRIEARQPLVSSEQPHVADRIDGGEQVDDGGAQDRPRRRSDRRRRSCANRRTARRAQHQGAGSPAAKTIGWRHEVKTFRQRGAADQHASGRSPLPAHQHDREERAGHSTHQPLEIEADWWCRHGRPGTAPARRSRRRRSAGRTG